MTGPIPVQTGRVTSEGDSLYYEVRGQGQPLILIPGAGGDADRYTRMAGILADEFRVITYDRRANARSSMNTPQNFEISQQSRDVVAVLQAAGETSAHVFGNSSGAVIALDLAKTQPQAVRTVIAHEPPVARVHPNAHQWQRFYAAVYRTAYGLGASLAAVRFLLGTGFPVRKMLKDARAGRSQTANDTEPRIPPKVAADVLMKVELLPVTNYLPDVETIKRNGACVVMAAGQDSLDHRRWYAQTAEILARQLGGEFIVFPGYHGSFLDQPDAFAAVLRGILRRA